jgi:OsmC subfamily peroxiredoxin
LRDTPYSYRARFETGAGTNPEELLAAAHAGRFAMAVSSQLGKAGLTPQKLEATATVTFEKVGEHFTITKSHLHLVALVPDAKQAVFDAAVKAADLRDRRTRKIAAREALYSDFIVESARLLVDALEHNCSDPQKLIPVYALLSRIRLSSSSRVLETAEEVMNNILANYSQPNITAEEIQSRAGRGKDPLRTFSDTCRIELESLERKL